MSLKILIAEDDDDLRSILRITLMDEGFGIIPCADGKEAMKQLETAKNFKDLPAMIILDLNMPMVDGWQVAAWLDADPDLRDIPVIVISATEEHGEEAKKLHADAYLVKPFTTDEIVGVVDLFSLL